MNPSIFSLVPPFLTICSALMTQRILPSLMLGILSATLILTEGALFLALGLVFEKIKMALGLTDTCSLRMIYDSSALMMFIFLLCLGCLITLITHSGGAYAYATAKNNKHLSVQQASIKTVILAFLLCIDDYFSTLTVGSVMKTITDHAKIPRIQLAFIITSLSTTLCAILPFSSWGAEIIGQLGVIGIGMKEESLIAIEPMYAFFLIIPCVIQAWSSIANMMTYIFVPVKFGPLHRQYTIAHETGNVWGGKVSPQVSIASTPEKNRAQASKIDFFIPLALLVFFLFCALLYTGGAACFGGTLSIMVSFKTAQASQALGITGLITLLMTTSLLLIRKKVLFSELPQLFHEGCNLMVLTLFMLTAAWTLTYIVKNDLKTGLYLASIFPQTISPLFLPAFAYIMAVGMTIGIGSAWAAIGLLLGILLPLAVQLLHLTAPILPASAPLLFIMMGAIISGSLMGNQISPIADVTVMASNCSGAYHIDFMQAQLWYTMPQIASVFCSYLLLGWASLYATSWHEWSATIFIVSLITLFAPRGYIALQNRRYQQ